MPTASRSTSRRRDGPAPVIQVSGRTVSRSSSAGGRSRRARDYDLNDAIADARRRALARAAQRGRHPGLPAGRARDPRGRRPPAQAPGAPAADAQRRDPAAVRAPVAGRAGPRVRRRTAARRIVLATNVAETSLTVPGIRYVIDAGLARVKRYSYRNKVEQLLVEPISQAAANQRAGRCGRVANGICIRLYDEKDFAGAAALHRPGDPALVAGRRDPAHEVAAPGRRRGLPVPRAAAARARSPTATSCSHELGAVDDANELTADRPRAGQAAARPARRPHDPRGARARVRSTRCWSSPRALSGAGRARPAARAAAGRPTRRTRSSTTRSREFLGYLQAVEVARRGARRPRRAPQAVATASTSSCCARTSSTSRRVREWRDIHSQLHTVVAEHGWRLNDAPATYEQLHLSMLAGLLGNIGLKSDDDEWYLGARGIKFYRHPGAHLSEEAGPLDRRGRAGRDHAPVRPRHRQRSSRSGSSRSPATC